MKNVQTRNQDGALRYFDSVREALECARKDKSIWKISFPREGEQIRLIRNSEDAFELEFLPVCFADIQSQVTPR